jgi:hypothetical protein
MTTTTNNKPSPTAWRAMSVLRSNGIMSGADLREKLDKGVTPTNYTGIGPVIGKAIRRASKSREDWDAFFGYMAHSMDGQPAFMPWEPMEPEVITSPGGNTYTVTDSGESGETEPTADGDPGDETP